LTRHGDVVLAGEGAHLLRYESGAAAAISGVQVKTIGAGGLFDGADVRTAIPPANHHAAPATLVAVENTHNAAGGRVFPLDRLRDVAATARAHGLALHMDGARIFNAEVATGIAASVWAEPFDSVTFCLSKGLGAPVGSLVCGSSALIDRVHRVRKMLGGGMRQAGILAAAGIYALERNVARLAEDHANARRVAAALQRLGLAIDSVPETNIVMFRVRTPDAFVRELARRRVLINPVSPGRFRAVTHLDVSSADVDEALGRIEEALA